MARRGALLVAVEVGEIPANPLSQVRMEQPFSDQRVERRAPPEGARQTHPRPPEKRRAAGLVEGEERPHPRVQARVGEGVGGELVAQEAPDDVLGVRDGVQGHGGFKRFGVERWSVGITHDGAGLPAR